jgi:hypothetical protein
VLRTPARMKSCRKNAGGCLPIVVLADIDRELSGLACENRTFTVRVGTLLKVLSCIFASIIDTGCVSVLSILSIITINIELDDM